ncbi:galactokinase-like [Condylostylus longicornis]|uniref:galactokinase-like n=1 Tax=Condylostylus longicornis TaxID=2530218 RepID=UPI00244E07E1|nr:galactokinase-like [Condylostylus longicornis]
MNLYCFSIEHSNGNWNNEKLYLIKKKITMIPTFEETFTLAKSNYVKAFGKEPEIAACAPGRVNLIGEHIDYNDGFVLPMALPMVTIIVGGKNGTESTVDLVTTCEGADLPKRDLFDTKNLVPSFPKWSNYVKGVLACYGQPVPGFNALIATNVPVGGGLSSSAALEVSTLTFIEQLTGKYIESEANKALICQKAEHTFAGMPCGIMDQFISVAGRKSNALLVDCRSLETFQIPFETNDLAILICNSNVRHELSDSEYPTRRNQCAKALNLMGLKSYRETKEEHLSALNGAGNEILFKRARHVITEIKRTLEAAEALKNQDFEKMGTLMTESHTSLRDDFEVSCRELDVLVNSAINCSGVLGSRMTGGGFGGCTVTLLRKDSVQSVMEKMQEDFEKECKSDSHKPNKNNKNRHKVDFYVCEPSDGTRVLQV